MPVARNTQVVASNNVVRWVVVRIRLNSPPRLANRECGDRRLPFFGGDVRGAAMSWVLFRWFSLIFFAATAGFFAVPILLCAGVPEVIGFFVLRAVGVALFASVGVLGTVIVAGHLLGIRLLRCPLCGSWAGWILRKCGEPEEVGPLLRCPECGDVHGGGVFRPWSVAVRPRKDFPWDIGPRIRPVLTAVCSATAVLYIWLAVRNTG